MRRVIAGNWKMNGEVAGVAAYAAGLAGAPSAHLAHVEMVICPPFPLLAPLWHALGEWPLLSSVVLGAQDCHAAGSGAHTGDVSAALLKELGCVYVILGHSERRADHGESNAEIAAKVEAARAVGLTPIVCVGESEAVRDAGEAEGFVKTQLAHSLPDDFDGIVAYEPIWAIGTGRTPSAADIAAMHAAIRGALVARFAGGAGMPILYGGSVKPENAAVLLAVPEVGGALVGGACLKAADLLAIAAAAPAY